MYTNASTEPFLEGNREILENSDKYLFYKTVDVVDIRAYFGILYIRSSLKVNLMDRETIWHHVSANDMFEATMSLNRFVFISRFLTFDDKPTRTECWRYDKFSCMREIMEDMNKNNASARYPPPYLAIDETLYPYRGHIGFKQYNPSKPAKYGLLYRSLCDSSISYTYYTLPYGGKPEVIGGDGAKFYVTGTDEYTKYLVTGVSKYNDIRGCNISMDRYFTSVTIARWCSERGITIVGTMRLDRKGIPKELKQFHDREERSTTYIYACNDDIMLVSYIEKKKSGKKRHSTHNDARRSESYGRSTPKA